jgi:hypothetical protein
MWHEHGMSRRAKCDVQGVRTMCVWQKHLAEGMILQNNSLQCRPELVIGLAAGIAGDIAIWGGAVASPLERLHGYNR